MSLGKYPDAQIRDFSEFLDYGSIAFLNAPFKKTSFSMFLKDIFLKFRHTGPVLADERDYNWPREIFMLTRTCERG